MIMTRPKIGVAALVFQEGKVLLHHRKGPVASGVWAPPGGHLEFGETIEECAKRELLEEAGIEALHVISGPWTNDVMDHGHYVTFFTFITQFRGTPQTMEPEKASDLHWCELHNLPEPLFPSVRSFIAKYGIEKIEAYLTQHH
jgi:8-oxo-dGTP diphosphatase